jgi:hypothetical protein
MSWSSCFARCSLALALIPPAALHAQRPLPHHVDVTAGGGFATSGAYFSGPAGLSLSGKDAFAGTLQVIVPVHPSFAIVGAGTYIAPDFQLSGVPLIGSVGLGGARIWFADASFRGQLPLGAMRPTVPMAFAQIGAGLAHYSVSSSALGLSVDESATNFAGAVGAGLDIPFTERLGIELMAKDYIASFRSVRDLAGFAVQGRRAHTILFSASARLAL